VLDKYMLFIFSKLTIAINIMIKLMEQLALHSSNKNL
jgi:hypothetical protein